MAYNYIIGYASSVNGPWTSAATVSSSQGNVSGLTPGATYYFRVQTVETNTSLVSAPVVVGPYTTAFP